MQVNQGSSTNKNRFLSQCRGDYSINFSVNQISQIPNLQLLLVVCNWRTRNWRTRIWQPCSCLKLRDSQFFAVGRAHSPSASSPSPLHRNWISYDPFQSPLPVTSFAPLSRCCLSTISVLKARLRCHFFLKQFKDPSLTPRSYSASGSNPSTMSLGSIYLLFIT